MTNNRGQAAAADDPAARAALARAAPSNGARADAAARAAGADGLAAKAAWLARLHIHELEQKIKVEMMEKAAAGSDSDAETLISGGADPSTTNSLPSIPSLRTRTSPDLRGAYESESESPTIIPTSPDLRSPSNDRFLKEAKMAKGDINKKGNKDDDKEENDKEDEGQETKRMRISSKDLSLGQMCEVAVRLRGAQCSYTLNRLTIIQRDVDVL